MPKKAKTFGEQLIESFREAMEILYRNKPPAAHSVWKVNADGSKTRLHYKKGVLVSKIRLVNGKITHLPLR